jgi:hypothetical protein
MSTFPVTSKKSDKNVIERFKIITSFSAVRNSKDKVELGQW